MWFFQNPETKVMDGRYLLYVSNNPNSSGQIHFLEPPQNLEKTIRWPQSWQCWPMFDAFWNSIFNKVSRPAKPLKFQHLLCENLFFTISGIPFWHPKSINKSYFIKPLSWTSFFSFYVDVFKKRSLLAPIQNPVGAKIRSHRPVSGVVRQGNVVSTKIARTWA